MPQDPDRAGSRNHRVLPSVDVALLPHERKAARARQTMIIGLVASVLLAVLAWLFGPAVVAWWTSAPTQAIADDGWPVPKPAEAPAGAGSEPSATNVDVATEVIEPAAPEPDPVAALDQTAGPEPEQPGFVERPFGQARGFRDAIRLAGVNAADADAIVTALEKLVDFRRCRPEHRLRLLRGAEGELEALEYRVSRTELYRATRSDQGFDGERVPVEIDRKRIARGGNIADSLGQALDHLGLGRSLVGAFVEVFERTISFKKDTREGDTFRIVVDEEFVEGESLGYGTVHAVEYTGERVGKLQGFWFETTAGKGDFYDAQGRAANGGWLRTPLRYDHISSPFNLRRRHPVLKRIVPHHGVDYAASSGTPVWAAADGQVTFAGYKGANGNLIAIRHADGYETFYAHLSRIARGIKRGSQVGQRQIIGAVGSTGRSTGPHLHFALKRRGRFIDPITQLNGPGKPLPARYMTRFRTHRKQLQAELEAIPLAPAPTDGAEASDPAAEDDVFHEEGAL